MDAANELYGGYLKFTVSKNEMVREVEKWDLPYEEELLKRAGEVLRYQAGKYLYMMG